MALDEGWVNKKLNPKKMISRTVNHDKSLVILTKFMDSLNFFGIKAPDGGFKGGARGFASILSACVVSVLISVTNFKASSCRSCFFFSQATANLWRWRQILLRIFDCGAWGGGKG